jgi:hypothetical protein
VYLSTLRQTCFQKIRNHQETYKKRTENLIRNVPKTLEPQKYHLHKLRPRTREDHFGGGGPMAVQQCVVFFAAGASWVICPKFPSTRRRANPADPTAVAILQRRYFAARLRARARMTASSCLFIASAFRANNTLGHPNGPQPSPSDAAHGLSSYAIMRLAKARSFSSKLKPKG